MVEDEYVYDLYAALASVDPSHEQGGAAGHVHTVKVFAPSSTLLQLVPIRHNIGRHASGVGWARASNDIVKYSASWPIKEVLE